MRSTTTFFVATILSLCFPQLLVAQPPHGRIRLPIGVFHTELGHVLNLETEGDTLFVSLDVPFVNAEDVQASGEVSPCGSSPRKELNYYALSLNPEVNKLSEAILLNAFMSGKQVRLMLQGCIGVFPQIAGVNIGKPLS